MIQVKNIIKKFGQFVAVNKISFSLKKGEVVGLLGPNGAGKTTTLRIMAGVFPPTQGEILINNKKLTNQNQSLKEAIGYLPENNPLYNEMTVEEFLNFWAAIKGLIGEAKKSAIDFVVLSTHIEEVFYRPIEELSKGFRQRVGLCQAILTKPNIILLDEPTEGLDPNQRGEIKTLIKTLGKDKTIIIASHVLSEISQICDRVIIINKGQIISDDKVANLKNFATGSQTIELEIKGNNVSNQLKQLSGVIKVKKLRPNYFVLETNLKKDLRESIYNLAKKNKWLILTMFKKELALEDVFLKLTGDKK